MDTTTPSGTGTESTTTTEVTTTSSEVSTPTTSITAQSKTVEITEVISETKAESTPSSSTQRQESKSMMDDDDTLPNKHTPLSVDINETNHHWKIKTFNSLTFCDYCAGLLWGICEQGFQCKDCNFSSHSKCIPLVKDVCKNSCLPGGNNSLPPRHHTFVKGNKGIKKFCNYCRETTFTISNDCFVCTDCKYIAHEQCRVKSPPMCRVPFNHLIQQEQPILTPPSSSSPIVTENVSSPSPIQDQQQQQPSSTLSPPYIHRHHWIEGNLKETKNCIVCSNKIETSFSLANYRCTWCNQSIHSQCFEKKSQLCNMGELHEMIIPPSSIHLINDGSMNGNSGGGGGGADNHNHDHNGDSNTNKEKTKKTVKWKLVSPIPNKSLFIFINSKSGGQMGETFIRKFSAIVNPFQIFDLIRDGPDQAITIIRDYLLENPQDQNRIRLLVCGGDGTVGWVLQVLKKYNLPPLPIAIIPLGTGNDMARSLGWGGGYDNEKLQGILKDISDVYLTNLDTWEINIKHEMEKDQEQDKMIVMNNYFSIGLDAHIALGFHEARNANPKLFIGRTINKMWYGKIGLGEFVSKSFVRLHDVLELTVDGHVIDIDPAIEGIMIINVNNYAGGADLWKGKRPKHLQPLEIDDGKIELVGVTGVPHMGTVISGMASPIKLAQGGHIVIKYKAPANPKKIKHTRIAVQVDGEPFKVHDSTISITFQRKVSMLVKKGFHTKSHHDNENYHDPIQITVPQQQPQEQSTIAISTSPLNNGHNDDQILNNKNNNDNNHDGNGDYELDLMVPIKQQQQQST